MYRLHCWRSPSPARPFRVRSARALNPAANLRPGRKARVRRLGRRQLPSDRVPRVLVSTTGTSSDSRTGTSSTPERPSPSGAAVVTAPAPQQATPIGRPNGEVAPQSAAPGSPSPCGGRPSTGATAPATPSSATASSFPGVSSSQLPRAGVSADAFVRPGVSAAQLSTLLPGARSSPCGPPRDFIPYPDAETTSRRAPPPSEDGP